jgi:hypothetical protein
VKRFLLFLTVALVMVAIVVVMTAPAFAGLRTVHKAPGSGEEVSGSGKGLDTEVCSNGTCPRGQNR